ncbi:MAG: methyltransferase [Candidatus Acidiferrales bacterium]
MSIQRKTILTIIVVGGGLGYYLWNLPREFWTLSRIVGLLITIPAFALWATARIQLGNSFALRAKATELVTHGLYSKFRNPVYVFGTLVIIGVLLAVGKPTWLLILLIVIPLQITRARREARILEQFFGDSYRKYRDGTWF